MRKYLAFKELDAGVIPLDWTIDQYLSFPLLNSFCFYVLRDYSSGRLQDPGTISLSTH